MWKWLAKWLGGLVVIQPARHKFEMAISLREDDGQLYVLRCTKCGYCTYLDADGEGYPPCIPKAHEWVPVKVFQWDDLPLANKLPQPLQCVLCGAHASTSEDWERFGCSGPRREDP